MRLRQLAATQNLHLGLDHIQTRVQGPIVSWNLANQVTRVEELLIDVHLLGPVEPLAVEEDFRVFEEILADDEQLARLARELKVIVVGVDAARRGGRNQIDPVQRFLAHLGRAQRLRANNGGAGHLEDLAALWNLDAKHEPAPDRAFARVQRADVAVQVELVGGRGAHLERVLGQSIEVGELLLHVHVPLLEDSHAIDGRLPATLGRKTHHDDGGAVHATRATLGRVLAADLGGLVEEVRHALGLVLADEALELEGRGPRVAEQLDERVPEARGVLDGAAAALGQVARAVLRLGLAQDEQLHASIGAQVGVRAALVVEGPLRLLVRVDRRFLLGLAFLVVVVLLGRGKESL